MFKSFVRNWWLMVLNGLAAIVFGLIALVSPGTTILALVYLFGAFSVIDGIFSLGFGIATRKEDDRWGMLAASGLVEIVFGVLVATWPQITALAFVYLVAAWAIMTGVLLFAAAIEFRKVLENDWLMILNSILSVAVGVVLIVNPAAGAVSLVWLIGLYAIANGVLDIVVAFRLHGLANKVEQTLKPRTV